MALALFESLVAELALALEAASRTIAEEQQRLKHAAWRAFRVELNDLYTQQQQRQKPAKRTRNRPPKDR
jgi:hypothetical protein